MKIIYDSDKRNNSMLKSSFIESKLLQQPGNNMESVTRLLENETEMFEQHQNKSMIDLFFQKA